MKSKQYLIEVNNLAVELLIESHKDYPSLWAARQPIAPKFECNSETLRTWHQKHLANLDWVHWYNVSPRPSPIEVVSRHVVAAHQFGYQDVLADDSTHLPNTHTGQYHLTLQTG